MDVPVSEEVAAEAPAAKKPRAPRAKKAAAAVAPVASDAPAIPLTEGQDAAPAAEDAGAAREIDADPGEAGSARRGWWQRTFGA